MEIFKAGNKKKWWDFSSFFHIFHPGPASRRKHSGGRPKWTARKHLNMCIVSRPQNRKPPQLGSPKTGLGCGPVWLCFSWGRCENSNFWGCMLYMNIDRSMEKLGVSDLGMVFDCLNVPSTILTGNTCEACAALCLWKLQVLTLNGVFPLLPRRRFLVTPA